MKWKETAVHPGPAPHPAAATGIAARIGASEQNVEEVNRVAADTARLLEEAEEAVLEISRLSSRILSLVDEMDAPQKSPVLQQA